MKNPVTFFKSLHPEIQSRIATGLLIIATVVGLVGLFNPNLLVLFIVVTIYVIAVMMVRYIRTDHEGPIWKQVGPSFALPPRRPSKNF